MNPLFACTPSDDELITAIQLWPELNGRRLRPLFVSAFGDIYVETSEGEVFLADPIELTCGRVASSIDELQRLFADSAWAQERLLTEVVLLAEERGKTRSPSQVFAVAPHPILGGQIRVENLMPMDLKVWHHICAEIRGRDHGA